MTEKNRVYLYKKKKKDLFLPHEFYQALLTLTVQEVFNIQSCNFSHLLSWFLPH